MTRIYSILVTVATIFLCAFCSEEPRSPLGAQKREYHYEYDCNEVLVRRYDMANYVMMELVKDGKVVDKVKARISKQDKAHSVLFDLYFTNYHTVLIIREYNPDISDSKVRFRRCGIKTVFLNNRDGGFVLDYFGNKSFRTVWWLKDQLEYLSIIKENGFFYPLDLSCAGMDTLYNHCAQRTIAVKMRVVDENGSVLYSNGI